MNKISYSQIKTWKRCRQKWYYGYVRNLLPKGRIYKIELGKYGHALLEAYYKGEDLKEASQVYWDEQTKDMFEEEMVEFEDTRFQAEVLSERYINHYEDIDRHMEILSAEGKFSTPINGGVHLRGIIDLVMQDDTGELWLVDHKFTSIDLIKYEDGLVLDEQANYYLWALAEMLGEDKPVAGIMFNLVKSKLPSVPKLLKSGGLSKAQSIDTDTATYLKAIEDNGLNPHDYDDILRSIEEKDRPFFKRHYVQRTAQELRNIGTELDRISKDMVDCRIYRNATKDCSWDCPYRELCIMEYKGITDEFYIENNFNIKEG